MEGMHRALFKVLVCVDSKRSATLKRQMFRLALDLSMGQSKVLSCLKEMLVF